jgi:hypothetical protein
MIKKIKILEVGKKAEAEAVKGKLESRRTAKVTTPEIEDEEEKDIENIRSDSDDDSIIVAARR